MVGGSLASGFMGQALAAAASASYATSPNPMVGAVVVRNGEVVGVGAHWRAGGPHAEVEALREAGDRARGAELFVTLEPCAHVGRTPPCTDAIVAAGLARCNVAMIDPNPAVQGRGIAALRRAGLPVSVGTNEREARRLNEFYIKHATTGLPFVTAKFAASLDGRIASNGGEARWISSPQARRLSHELRQAHDAILVGIGTVIHDDPRLTTRLGVPSRSPHRVILDSHLRVAANAKVLDQSEGGVTIAATERAPTARVREFEGRGVSVVVLPSWRGRVRLDALLCHLGRRNLISLLIEGGASVHGSAFDGRHVDKVVAVISPRVIGGSRAPAAVAGEGAGALLGAPLLSEVSVGRIGADVVVTGYCCP